MSEQRRTVHMPPNWTAEKKAKFEAWLNDELTADEGRELLALNGKRKAKP